MYLKIMPNGIKPCFLPISIICIVFGSISGFKTNAAVTNGADIYCFMRNGGNTHEPSWEAAYQFIKNKKPGLFKTSPKQAASFIVEEVVQDPIKYEDCISYLGDLYTGDSTSKRVSNNNDENEKSIDTPEKTPKGLNIDSYIYSLIFSFLFGLIFLVKKKD